MSSFELPHALAREVRPLGIDALLRLGAVPDEEQRDQERGQPPAHCRAMAARASRSASSFFSRSLFRTGSSKITFAMRPSYAKGGW